MADVPVSIIFHDNARAHTADAVRDLLRRWGWKTLEHPPYSSDMSLRLRNVSVFTSGNKEISEL
jgi:hypothetical protein